MEVVYKKTILDQITEAKYQADIENKIIDYIKLTPQEADEFYERTKNTIMKNDFSKSKLMPFYHLKSYRETVCENVNHSQYFGIQLRVSGY